MCSNTYIHAYKHTYIDTYTHYAELLDTTIRFDTNISAQHTVFCAEAESHHSNKSKASALVQIALVRPLQADVLHEVIVLLQSCDLGRFAFARAAEEEGSSFCVLT
jgi:hypothetical protein